MVLSKEDIELFVKMGALKKLSPKEIIAYFVDEEFEEICMDANKIFQGHKKTKGESYQRISKTTLLMLLKGEVKEVLTALDNKDYEKAYKEVLDVRNFCDMLAWCLKKKHMKED